MGSKRRATEVVAARGRLKGALQEVVTVADDDESHDSSNAAPHRGRPPKRLRKDRTPPPPVNHSFIMKLFDRSVDLAKYNENTALYPICRAWMINQPRSNSIASFINRELPEAVERKPLPGLLEDITLGKKVDVTELPKCLKMEKSRIPSPLPFQKECKKEHIDLDYDLNEPPMSREELLADLKTRCEQVRKKWTETSKAYEDAKYGPSMRILESIYKR